MEEILKFIDQKKEEYRELRRRLLHDSVTAKKLGFDTEMQKIEIDRKWAMDIIDELEEIAKKVQSYSNSK